MLGSKFLIPFGLRTDTYIFLKVSSSASFHNKYFNGTLSFINFPRHFYYSYLFMQLSLNILHSGDGTAYSASKKKV